MAESKFKRELKKEIQEMFPDCIILSLNPNDIQGIPDLLVLVDNTWFSLEVKDYAKAWRQPNQEYYVKLMNEMSYSRVIFPENKEEVLDELQDSFSL